MFPRKKTRRKSRRWWFKSIGTIVIFLALYLIATDRREVPVLGTTASSHDILYYGVTHSSSIHKAIMSENTWARRLSNAPIPWYSDLNDNRIRNLKVLVPQEGSGYDEIYYRTLMIVQDVYEKFPGHDWYVRVWDDNFIFPERIEEIAEKYKHLKNELVEIGRLGYHNNDGERVQFVGGGASSLVSGKLMKENAERANECPKEITGQEDVTMSICRRDVLKAKFVREEGFHALSPRPGTLNIYPSDLSCRSTFKENDDTEGKGAIPITFHYVGASQMKNIERAWYLDECHERSLIERILYWRGGAQGSIFRE